MESRELYKRPQIIGWLWGKSCMEAEHAARAENKTSNIKIKMEIEGKRRRDKSKSRWIDGVKSLNGGDDKSKEATG